MTSVAFVPEDGSEPVSPELALIDPTLAARLRADLSEPAPEPERVEPRVETEAEAALPLEDVESAPVAPPPVEIEPEDAPVVEAPEPPSASIHVLRAPAPVEEAELVREGIVEPVAEARPEPHLELAPAPEPEPELAREPELAPEPLIVARPEPAEPAVPVARLPVIPTPPPSRSPRPSSVSPLRRRSRLWQLIVLLATIVLFAGVVTVGVVGVSELRDRTGSSGATATSEPPVAAAPQPGDETDEPTATPAPAPADGGGSGAPVVPRRFAWAPVDGAGSYRFELFRGDEQVLVATTRSPAYQLPTSWRHEGRTERLTSGSYRWYVWPVLASGPADAAVVQASLDVP